MFGGKLGELVTEPMETKYRSPLQGHRDHKRIPGTGIVQSEWNSFLYFNIVSRPAETRPPVLDDIEKIGRWHRPSSAQ